MVEGGAPKSSAVYFNPVQVDMQWIRRVQKEERILMDAMGNEIKPGKQPNKVDDVYQQFGSAYFYQSEYLKNHMYNNDGGNPQENKFKSSNKQR